MKLQNVFGMLAFALVAGCALDPTVDDPATDEQAVTETQSVARQSGGVPAITADPTARGGSEGRQCKLTDAILGLLVPVLDGTLCDLDGEGDGVCISGFCNPPCQDGEPTVGPGGNCSGD